MKGEPEPNSVIEARVAVRVGRSLGQVERKCLRCGRDWDGDIPNGAAMTLGRRGGVCSNCGGNEFSEREIRPAVMGITGAGISEVAEPPKSKVAATADDLFALRSLRTSLIDVENRLLNADEHLHRLVNVNDANFAVFGFLQQALHALTDGNIGDFELRAITPLTTVSRGGPSVP